MGRTALVTGASRGIGQAIAASLAAAGAQVVLCSRKEDALLVAKADIARRVPGAQLVARPCHVGQSAAILDLFKGLDADGITVDALVNNAGTNPYFGPMLSAQAAAWDKTFDVNLRGPFELSRQVAQRLIDQGRPGSIVNVSSIFGSRAAPFQGIYGMTKAALISLTRTLAMEWGAAGIRVNAIAPGLVETRLSSMLMDNDAVLAQYNARTALGRHAQPGEIAGTVLTLLSAESSYTTGQVIALDGGWLVS